jgi:hypothetical protein
MWRGQRPASGDRTDTLRDVADLECEIGPAVFTHLEEDFALDIFLETGGLAAQRKITDRQLHENVAAGAVGPGGARGAGFHVQDGDADARDHSAAFIGYGAVEGGCVLREDGCGEKED